MSQEVKRFFIMPGAVHVMQGDSPAYTPMTNHETFAHTVPVVLASDYDALLAERDALLEVMVEARQVIAVALRANAPDWYATDEEVSQHMTIRKIDAAMQGEQS